MATAHGGKMMPAHCENGGLDHRLRPGGDTLVVVFSQVRVPEGKFGLERMFAGTTHSLLLLNDPANVWYRPHAGAIDRLIGEAVASLRPARLVFYGSSMGAFGAAATAARWPEAEIYAFAPDWRIGEPGSQSAAAGLCPDPAEADLGAHLGRPRQGRARVVIGLYDAYDGGVGARLAARALPDTVELVALRSSHELHDHLYSLNVIRKLTATFRRDLAVEAAARGLVVDQPDWDGAARLAGLQLGADAGERLVPQDVLAVTGGVDGVNPGARLLAAEAAERAGDLAWADDILAGLDRAILADPVLSGLTKRYLKEVPRRRIRLLAGMGRSEAARGVAEAAALRFPTDEAFRALAKAEGEVAAASGAAAQDDQ